MAGNNNKAAMIATMATRINLMVPKRARIQGARGMMKSIAKVWLAEEMPIMVAPTPRASRISDSRGQVSPRVTATIDTVMMTTVMLRRRWASVRVNSAKSTSA